MTLLLEWGEETDLSCVCVAETVFLTETLTNEMSGIFAKS